MPDQHRTILETFQFLCRFQGDDEAALKAVGMSDERINGYRNLFGTCEMVEVLHSYFQRKQVMR